MSSVELNNYPHRGEDNDVRHDPGHHRCPVMDGSGQSHPRDNMGSRTPYKCEEEEEACCVLWMIDRQTGQARAGRGVRCRC